MKKIIAIVLLAMPIVFSQEAGILLNNYGYGESPNEVKFTIHCSGDVPISDITVYVDGEEYKRLPFTLNPKKGISTTLILEPGEHLVEVKTPEGAYDSEVVSVSSVPHETFKPEESISFTKSNTFKAVVVFVAISVVVVCLLMKRPKLGL